MGRIKIGWLSAGKNNSIVIRANGQDQLWAAGTWSMSKLKSQFVDKSDSVSFIVFEPLNDYLATLPDEVIDNLIEVYTEALELLNDSVDVDREVLNHQIHLIMHDICRLIDYEDFSEWIGIYGRLNFVIGEKTELAETDSADITYFTDEYRKLLIFSVYLKLFAPIWGLYHSVKRKELGESQTFLTVLGMFRNEIIDNNPTMIRLFEYVDNLSKKRIKTIDYVLTTDLSTESIVEHCVITVLWKRVIIFDARSEVSIIKNLFNALDNIFNKISAAGPKLKYQVGGDEGKREPPPKLEAYKIFYTVTPFVQVAVNEYISSGNYLKGLDEVIPERELEEMFRYIEELEIRKSHMTICAAVMKKSINTRDFQFFTYVSMRRLITTSACLLLRWGLPALADFITATPKEKNISLLASGGKSIMAISPSLMAKAQEKYSIVGSVDELLDMKENLMKELICYDWNFRYGKAADFGNELFTLVLRD